LIAGAQKLKVDLVLPRPGDSFEPNGIQDEMKKKWWPDIPWETAEQAPVQSTGL